MDFLIVLTYTVSKVVSYVHNAAQQQHQAEQLFNNIMLFVMICLVVFSAFSLFKAIKGIQEYIRLERKLAKQRGEFKLSAENPEELYQQLNKHRTH